MEKELRTANIVECLLPVFANSVEELIGPESYGQLDVKIARLLDFAEKKGFNYDQTLDSKPGKGIAKEVMKLYHTEVQSKGIQTKIKNRLDETLVKANATDQDGNPVNLEEEVNKAFSEFTRLLDSKH